MKDLRKKQITYKQRPNVTREEELEVLANVYRYILDCGATRKTAPKDGDRQKNPEEPAGEDRG